MAQFSKKLNEALVDQSVREQWLKRLLPGVLVTVIYFVFISSTLSQKAQTSETEVRNLKSKGIDQQVISSLNSRIDAVQAELTQLKQQDKALMDNLLAKAGFLFGTSNMNEVVYQIAESLKFNHLSILEERSIGQVKLNSLPPSFADFSQWLLGVTKIEENAHIHRFSFVGLYPDVYKVLMKFARGEINAVPVYLTMKNPDAGQLVENGKKVWIMDVWI